MALSGRMWDSLDNLTLKLIEAKKKGSPTRSAQAPPGRQADMTEAETWEEDGLSFLYLGNVGFSLWRVVELNLVRQFKDKFVDPVIDVGCGDGAFYQLAVGSAEIGMDIFDEVKEVARPGVYKTVMQGDITKDTGIPAGSLNTVFANSVMEHIGDLDAALKEISRLLAPGGRFIATVPMKPFLDGLTAWTGLASSEALHRRLAHVNLLSDEEWSSRLAGAGMELELVHHYFSPAAGRLIRIVNGPFFGNVERRKHQLVYKLLRNRIRRLVKESMDCPDGYCGLVIGRKP